MGWRELMQRGEFEAAWRLSDELLHVPAEHLQTPRHFQRIWNGAPLEGRRVLVRCYHGLGDTIQFIRYVPRLTRIAREVTIWTPAALLDLLASVCGPARVMPLHDGVPEVEYDVDIELMELAHAFRTTVETIPDEVPYIHLCHGRQPAKAGAPGLRVGFVWRAGNWDPARSIDIADLRPLLGLPGVRTVVLQAEPGAEEAACFDVVPPVVPIRRLAEVLVTLDLVITVDTMAAHLAGALGVRTWLLLNAQPDWRWMLDRDDTPWYPRTTLYRQRELGDWTPVIARVRQDLMAALPPMCRPSQGARRLSPSRAGNAGAAFT